MTDLSVGIARYMIKALFVKNIFYKLKMWAMGRLGPAVISRCSQPSLRRIFYV